MQISSEAQFNVLMEKVDECLKQEGVPIHARPIRGWILASQILKMRIPFGGKSEAHVYEGGSLSGHIQDWFTELYGDRLKVDFSPVRFPILIRHDLFLVRAPLIFGEIAVFIDRSTALSPKKDGPAVGPPRTNILDWVQDFTERHRNALSDAELNFISQFCWEGFQQHNVWRLAGQRFEQAIQFDLDTSADLAAHGVLGMSRWHSLQAAEKAIKFFIQKRGAKAPHIHELGELHKKARVLGLSELNGDDLRNAQCSASVRYESKDLNPTNTLVANIAARNICTSIARQSS